MGDKLSGVCEPLANHAVRAKQAPATQCTSEGIAPLRRRPRLESASPAVA